MRGMVLIAQLGLCVIRVLWRESELCQVCGTDISEGL